MGRLDRGAALLSPSRVAEQADLPDVGLLAEEGRSVMRGGLFDINTSDIPSSKL